MKRSWYESAIVRVGAALEGVPLDADDKQVRRILRDAYPWGERRHWPYKMWRKACRDVLAARRMGLLAPALRHPTPPDPSQADLFQQDP